MPEDWKKRLIVIAPWLLFAGSLAAWTGNGCQGPPPTPPLLQQVAEQQAETLSRVKALEAGIGTHRVEIK